MATITDKTIKAFAKFNDELKAFGEETGETFVTLYEDINTTRRVADFHLCKNGKLKWVEMELTYTKNGSTYLSQGQTEQMYDEDEAKDYLKFWKACLRRARKYWATDGETLDKMAEGEVADIEVEE